MTVFFNNYGKLDLYYILKIRYLVIKNNPEVLFIKLTGMIWRKQMQMAYVFQYS